MELNTMGFIRQQEEKLAVRLLTWRYQKMNISVPDSTELKNQASKLVEDAHKIARERGRNVISIMKDLVDDLKRK
jgi:hypothetical protein